MKKIKYDINIDKLEVQYLLTHQIVEVLSQIEDVADFFEFTIKRSNSNRNYKNTFDILIKDYNNKDGIHDIKLGTLYYGSLNPIRNQIYISIENRELYSDNLISIHFIETKLNLQFMAISKIDIAFDCNKNIINKYYSLIKKETINYLSFAPIVFKALTNFFDP